MSVRQALMKHSQVVHAIGESCTGGSALSVDSEELKNCSTFSLFGMESALCRMLVDHSVTC